MNDHGPVPYAGPRGIRALLDGMHELLGWEPIMEGENIIGLADVTGGGAISLEPGGQFELSGAPVDNVHQTASELFAHLAQVREVARPLDIGFLGLGMTPRWTRADIPKMPKGRYKIMTAYMPKVGTLGLDMMYRTCTVQTNHDFSSEADMVTQDAGCVSRCSRSRPRCSPTRRSPKASRTASSRSAPRSGATPTTRGPACCPGCSRTAWASSATPTTRSTCRCISSSAATAISTCPASRSAIISRASCVPGEVATISDWANHVSTIFPEVRLKRYIEMRGSDGGPWRRLPSLPAFWVGLIYDDANLDACWEIVKDWSAGERQKLRDDVPKLGFKAKIRNRTLLDIAGETLQLAEKGLVRRQRLDRNGRDETRYLRPLQESVARGITPAEELLDDFNGPWNGSVDPVFFELAY